jgi:hypothetical protein
MHRSHSGSRLGDSIPRLILHTNLKKGVPPHDREKVVDMISNSAVENILAEVLELKS